MEFHARAPHGDSKTSQIASLFESVVELAFLILLGGLLINVVASVISILRERDGPDSADKRANRVAAELEPQRPVLAAPAHPTQPMSEAPIDPVAAKQALSEG